MKIPSIVNADLTLLALRALRAIIMLSLNSNDISAMPDITKPSF
jgi:hypothetical protein